MKFVKLIKFPFFIFPQGKKKIIIKITIKNLKYKIIFLLNINLIFLH